MRRTTTRKLSRWLDTVFERLADFWFDSFPKLLDLNIRRDFIITSSFTTITYYYDQNYSKT